MIGGSQKDRLVASNWNDPDIYFQPRVPVWRFPPIGYAARSVKLAAGEDTAVFIVAGQSNAAAFGSGTVFVPTNASKVDTLNIFEGSMWEGKDPGPNMDGWTDGSGRSWLYRLADSLITAGTFQRVIMVPLGMGSAACSYYEPGGPLAGFLPAAIARCEALGLPITAILWQQGEREGALGVSQAVYQASLLNVIATTRAAGFAGPWIVGKSTLNANVTSAPIRAALAAVVNGVDVFAGADTDSLTGGTNRSDGTHFTATGNAAAAALWKTAIEAVV